MQLAAIERPTTVDLVVDRIAKVIKDQKLAAGSRLPGEHDPDAAESAMRKHMQAVIVRLEKQP